MDLSIVIPAIRQSYWFNLYKSIEKSCTKYSWELILISPFDLPNELKEYKNIKLIKDFGHPTRCLQLGIFEADGDLFYHTTDDALLFPNVIDENINKFNSLNNDKLIINMKYREGKDFSGQSMRGNYWLAYGHDGLRLAGIPQHYKISLHHMLKTDYLRELGGYDCGFHHANFSLHDFIFRAQAD